MTEHKHDFKPMRMLRARYECECGEQAYRDIETGKLVPAKRRVKVQPELTVANESYWIDGADDHRAAVSEKFFRTHSPERAFQLRFIMRKRI